MIAKNPESSFPLAIPNEAFYKRYDVQQYLRASAAEVEARAGDDRRGLLWARTPQSWLGLNQIYCPRSLLDEL
jgi:hypothetical protein